MCVTHSLISATLSPPKIPGLRSFHYVTKSRSCKHSSLTNHLFRFHHAFQPWVNGSVGNWVAHVKQSWKESEEKKKIRGSASIHDFSNSLCVSCLHLTIASRKPVAARISEHDKVREELSGKKRGSPCLLWAAIIEKQHRIFDRHEAIICPLYMRPSLD